MTVDPEYFVESMAKRYGIQSSDALKQAWREMAVILNNSISGKIFVDHTAAWIFPEGAAGNKDDASQWSILRLPTGAGKTLGLSLYCSLLSEKQEHPGVLIITKFTKEIDALVEKINSPPYQTTAYADHSDKEPLSHAELYSAPTLLITHSIYQKALKTEAQDEAVKAWWDKFTKWKHGSRKLIVIDEALDIVEPIAISLDTLRVVRGWVPRWLEKEHPDKLEAFDKIIAQFYDWEEKYSKEFDSDKVLPEFWEHIDKTDIAWLRDQLCELPLGQIVLGRSDRSAVNVRCKEFFADLLTALSSLSWCEWRKGIPTLRTAYVALPTHVKNAVVMDATAQINRVYELLGSLPYYPPLPKNIRSYKNVSLHVQYGFQNSKDYLSKEERDEKHFIDAINALHPKIQSNKRFLLVTFKGVREKLAPLKRKYRKCAVAHWGGLNGKNNWKDYDTIVLYGLPRLDGITPKSVVLAFDNWHRKTQNYHAAPLGYHEEMPDGSAGGMLFDNFVDPDEYHTGYVVANVIQAINRIRCRQIIDEHGNCSTSDVYLLFNHGSPLEKAILSGIKEEMPLIVLSETVAPTLNTFEQEELTAKQKAVIEFFEDKKPGKYLAKEIYKEIEERGIAKRTVERCIASMQNEPQSLISRHMQGIGVTYEGEKGKYGQSRFIIGRKLA